MAGIAIVTDTSSDLTPEQAEAARVRLVPLTVSFGDETFDAVTELSNEDFYARLTAPGAPLPRTAAPNPARFESAYREALDAGAEGVVCVTISQRLSATYASAVQGATAFEPGLVQVIDSTTVTQPLGLIVRRAAELARTGAGMAEVVDRVVDLAGRTDIFFAVHTLEYLQRGGRIGRATALLGTMLSIKPILTLDGGEVAPLDRRRTSSKARERIIELAVDRSLDAVAVVHSEAADLDTFVTQLARAAHVPEDRIEVGLCGPVAGTHAGPGLIGVTRIATA
jgi:fatty acid kinase fatty acid binding subunit